MSSFKVILCSCAFLLMGLNAQEIEKKKEWGFGGRLNDNISIGLSDKNVSSLYDPQRSVSIQGVAAKNKHEIALGYVFYSKISQTYIDTDVFFFLPLLIRKYPMVSNIGANAGYQFFPWGKDKRLSFYLHSNISYNHFKSVDFNRFNFAQLEYVAYNSLGVIADDGEVSYSFVNEGNDVYLVTSSKYEDLGNGFYSNTVEESRVDIKSGLGFSRFKSLIDLYTLQQGFGVRTSDHQKVYFDFSLMFGMGLFSVNFDYDFEDLPGGGLSNKQLSTYFFSSVNFSLGYSF